MFLSRVQPVFAIHTNGLEISKEGDPSIVRGQTVFAIHTNGLEISKEGDPSIVREEIQV